MIPIILLIFSFKKNKLFQPILYILATISLIMSISVYTNDINLASTRLNNDTTEQLTAVRSKYSKAKFTTLDFAEKPDYFPNVSKVVDSQYNLLNSRKNYIHNQTIIFHKRKIDIKKIDMNNGIIIHPMIKNKLYGNFTLPLLGYKSLTYHIKVNGHPVDSFISNQGYITMSNAKLNSKDCITISFHNPAVYNKLILISIVIILIICGILCFS